ncbi:MAG TPA: methyltransferase domain-containing protein [Thermoanaerobaculia bacterium]|jgi:SAM-dependent methyltransferase|nr:methyltransferase domain-containing protein [Thermoanaerobaculia bacterium]
MATEEIRRTLDRLAEAAQAADAGRFHKLLETSSAEVREYLMSIELEGTTPAFTASYVGDALRRFLHTLSFIPLPAGRRILELGGNPYFFHILLRRIFPGSSVEAANFFDHNIFSREIGSATHRLRSPLLGEEWTFTYPTFNLEAVPRYPLPPASFDLIFFCETLEHLVVNPLAVFRKIRRLLAPGGHLIITLPNAVRLTNLALMLDGHNFFDLYHPDNGIHGRHNREFTLDEMKNLLALNGLAVRRAETRDRFDYDHVPIVGVDYSGKPVIATRRRLDLVKVLQKAGGRLDDRGDNLYLLAQRPAQAPPTSGQPAPRQETGLATCPPPPPPSARVTAYVDERRDEAGRLYVHGWGFLSDEWGDESEWIRLVLRSAERCFSVACSRQARQDVADRFGLDRDDPGFQVSVDKTSLPPGRYRLGLLLGGPGLQEGFQDLGIDVLAG